MTQEVVEELREGKFHVLSLGGGWDLQVMKAGSWGSDLGSVSRLE